MPANAISLLASCLVMVLLALTVALAMLANRVREMRRKRIHPQAAATSVAMSARLENVQAADNFRNLFEVPVLFYALVAMALAIGFFPDWLVIGAWTFVVLRLIHSLIHCTYNRVYHRLAVFLVSFILLAGLWAAFVLSLLNSIPT